MQFHEQRIKTALARMIDKMWYNNGNYNIFMNGTF